METKNKAGKVSLSAIIACLIVELCVGIPYTWSVLKTDLVRHFDWSISAANNVMAIMMFGFSVGVLSGGVLQDRLKPRPVAIGGCILFGLCMASPAVLTKESIGLMFVTYPLAGIGCGAAYASCLSCVQKWMPHKLGLASGLAIAAFGAATIVFSPVCNWLLHLPAFGDRAVPLTFATLGVSFMAVGTLAGVFMRLPPRGHAQALGVVGRSGTEVYSYTLAEAVRCRHYWYLVLAHTLMYSLWIVIMAIIKDLGLHKGLTDAEAVLTVSLTGVGNATGRVLLAQLGDKIGLKRTYGGGIAVMLVCAILLIFVQRYVFAVVVVITTFFVGGCSTLSPAIATNTFGPRYSGRNFGIISLGGGISTIVLSAISSNMFEKSGSYTPAFMMAAVLMIVPLILLPLVHRATKMQREG